MFLREFWPRAERIRRSRERRRFVSVKKCVTDRAVADPFAFEFGQALYIRCEPSAAGRQKYRLAHVLFVVRGDDGESAVLIINRHRLLVREFHSEPFGTVNSACQKLFSANRFGKAVIVFDFFGFCECTVSCSYHCGFKTAANCIQRRRNAGRACSDYDYIRHTKALLAK